MTYEQNLSYGMSYIKAVRGSSWAGETPVCTFPNYFAFSHFCFLASRTARRSFNSVATKAIEVRLLAAAGASVDAPGGRNVRSAEAKSSDYHKEQRQ